MTYFEAIDFLFNSFPMFQRQGASAYKPGLDATRALDAAFGSPSMRLRAVHVAGTNGKGSTAHSLAAVAQSAGLRTGLFTSPHLVDFRERIRIDGKMIPEQEVIRFVERYQALEAEGQLGHLSFFELTTVMAFDWFARCGVDLAVIEVGLGGRLDSTNILPSPLLSVITNISFDHTALLGDTLPAIASEKAGIIKPGVPVVIGEHLPGTPVGDVFAERCAEVGTTPIYAQALELWSAYSIGDSYITYYDTPFGTISCDLTGQYQPRNMATVLTSLLELRQRGLTLPATAVRNGLHDVTGLTGLMGRWMRISDNPLVIADTGHNPGGWKYILPRLTEFEGTCHLVLGFVNDKDVSGILRMIAALPDKRIYWTKASVNRALPADELSAIGKSLGIDDQAFDDVASAYKAALRAAGEQTAQGGNSMVFVGGSTFVVADLLASV